MLVKENPCQEKMIEELEEEEKAFDDAIQQRLYNVSSKRNNDQAPKNRVRSSALLG